MLVRAHDFESDILFECQLNHLLASLSGGRHLTSENKIINLRWKWKQKQHLSQWAASRGKFRWMRVYFLRKQSAVNIDVGYWPCLTQNHKEKHFPSSQVLLCACNTGRSEGHLFLLYELFLLLTLPTPNVCGFFPHTKQFSNSPDYRTPDPDTSSPELVQTAWAEGSVLEGFLPLQMLITSWISWTSDHLAINQGFYDPLLGFSNLLQRFTELREALNYYWFIIKYIKKDTNKQAYEEVHRVRSQGSQVQELLFLKSEVCHPPRMWMHLATQKLPNSIVQNLFFQQRCPQRHDRILIQSLVPLFSLDVGRWC